MCIKYIQSLGIALAQSLHRDLWIKQLSKVKDLELKGHTNSVDQLCWDPKHAHLIATTSGDKNVCLWDVCSGKCSQQAELSGENINITYKPDGTHVAVGNRVHSVGIVSKAVTILGKYLTRLCMVLLGCVHHSNLIG
uniref:Anaphase-promoting complex subunit 4 WD40 domain-containing protein n=1 Tax=Lactuca sativa TaxID=4236 RepID=A0A9R1WN10_LACSA|nr:hypothetical protein LSAT_V11C100048840 [Lactuca sativa]